MTPNPHVFVYPGFILYVEAGVVALVQLLERAVPLSRGTITSVEYIAGRLTMVGSSIATVALVGLLGRRMAPRHRTLVGLVAAGLLVVSFLHVKDSALP